MDRRGDLNAPGGTMALHSARHVYSVAPNVKNKFAFANDARTYGSRVYADTDRKLRSIRSPDLSCFIQHLERGFSYPVQMFGNSVRYATHSHIAIADRLDLLKTVPRNNTIEPAEQVVEHIDNLRRLQLSRERSEINQVGK